MDRTSFSDRLEQSRKILSKHNIERNPALTLISKDKIGTCTICSKIISNSRISACGNCNELFCSKHRAGIAHSCKLAEEPKINDKIKHNKDLFKLRLKEVKNKM